MAGRLEIWQQRQRRREQCDEEAEIWRHKATGFEAGGRNHDVRHAGNAALEAGVTKGMSVVLSHQISSNL